mgnify:CR=1 FL=1
MYKYDLMYPVFLILMGTILFCLLMEVLVEHF